MFRFFLLAAGLHVLSTLLLSAGVFVLGPPLFVLPVAWYWCTGCRQHALGLVGVAGFAGLGVDWRLSALAMLVAGLGVVLGSMLLRRWPFGRIVTGLTAVVFTPIAVVTALNWDAAVKAYEIWTVARIAEFDAAAKEQSNQGNDSLEAQAEVVHESFQWIADHAAYLNVGWTFTVVLLVVTAAVALLNRRLLRHGSTARAEGAFKDMRPPEWLVWLAIALAACWFIDNRWPNEALRIMTWNSAIALAAVYWLNGMSIIVYGLSALGGGAMLGFVVLLAMIITAGLHALPASIGLFDTWVDFRGRIDRIAELRRARAQSGNDNE